MIYTCPKCGKKMDLSVELLIDSNYKVVCPQCLSELTIVGDYAYIAHDSLDLDTSVEPSRTITCSHCGQDVSSNAHFCPNCGTSFDAAPHEQLPSVPPFVPPTPQGMATDAAPEDVEVLPPLPPGADPLYNEALQFLTTCVSITPMMLRDRFHISDERAAELIRQLEAGGAIGPYNDGGPRRILIPHVGSNMCRSSVRPAPGQPEQGYENQQQGPQPQIHSCSGFNCITIFLIIMFITMLMRGCG